MFNGKCLLLKLWHGNMVLLAVISNKNIEEKF